MTKLMPFFISGNLGEKHQSDLHLHNRIIKALRVTFVRRILILLRHGLCPSVARAAVTNDVSIFPFMILRK